MTVLATAATLRDDEGHSLGVMVFIDDITEIQKVQRMEAWREVARRIAHEIKNPLTPIQLSAERLRKRYAKLLEGDGAVLDKCTTTIIRQVEELKNLVNEFAQFARLPVAGAGPFALAPDAEPVALEDRLEFTPVMAGIEIPGRGQCRVAAVQHRAVAVWGD